MKKKARPEKTKTEEEKKRSPVIRTAKGVLRLMQNKVIASLMMLGQGVLFLISPSGDMKPTIRISAGLIILVSLVLIILHLKQPKKSALDIAIAVFNGLLIPAAAFCLASPHTIEPFVRFAVGIVTIVTGLINLIETLKIKNKKDWKFVVSVAGAVALIALGIVMAAAHVDSVAVTQRVIGIFLVLNAVANIWYFIQFRREARESERSTEQPAA